MTAKESATQARAARLAELANAPEVTADDWTRAGFGNVEPPDIPDDNRPSIEDWIDPRFGGLAGFSGRDDAAEFHRFLADPPREVLEDLAKSDPQLAQRLNGVRIKEACEAFMRATPDFHRSEANTEKMVQHMAKSLLRKDWLSYEDAEEELAREGHFTAANLAAAFKALKAAGRLEVKPGTTKILSRKEEAEVIACIATEGESNAVIHYMNFALGGLPLDIKNPRDLLARHSKLCARAAEFVWRHSRPLFRPSSEWDAFLQAHLQGRRALVTIPFLDAIWAEFIKGEPPHIATPRPVDHDDPTPDFAGLSDAELSDLMLATRREHALSSRLRGVLGSR